MCRRNTSTLSSRNRTRRLFWVDVCEDKNATLHSPQQRMETLISQALVPVVQALEATGEINGKLIWSNTGI